MTMSGEGTDCPGPTWTRLVDLPDDHMLFRGTLLRCAGQYPYEKLVDFLAVRLPDADCGLTLVVASGYKSGLILVRLPLESESGHAGYADYINTGWLKANWTKWVYPECPIDQIHVAPGALAPEELPG